MKKILSCVILFCMTLTLSTGVVNATQTGNLFPLGSFEDGTDGFGLMNCTLAPAYDAERGNVAKMTAMPQQLVHLELGNTTLEPNTDYMISVWIRAVSGVEINPRLIFVNGNEQALYKWVYFSDPTYPADPTDGVWHRATCIYNSGDSFLKDNTVLFRVGSETAANNVGPMELYLDDLYFGKPLPSASAKADGMFAVNGTVTASYQYDKTYNNLEEGQSRYRMLMADTLNGEWTEVATGAAQSGEEAEYTFAESDIGRYFKYEVIPVDTEGNEGMAAFTAPKRIEDYFTVTSAMDEPAAGTALSGSITVANYGEPITPAAVMVLRDEGNVLSDVYTLRQEVQTGTEQVFPTRLTMPDSLDGYTVEQYLWYDFARFSPLTSKDFSVIYPAQRYTQPPGVEPRVTFDYETMQLNISAASTAQELNIIVLKPNQELDGIKNANHIKQRVYSLTQVPVENGSASVSIHIPTSAESGVYKAYFAGEGTVTPVPAEAYFAGAAEDAAIAAEIRAAFCAGLTDQGFRDLMTQYTVTQPVFYFDLEEDFKELSGQMRQFMEGEKERFQTLSDISASFRRAQFTARMSVAAGEKLTQLLDDFVNAYRQEDTALYQGIRSSVAAVYERLADGAPPKSQAENLELFRQALILGQINTADRVSLSKLVETYRSDLGVSYQDCDPIAVNKKLAGQTFYSFQEFAAAFQDAKAALGGGPDDSDSRPSRPNSRPGGGGGVGGVTQAITVDKALEPAVDLKEIDMPEENNVIHEQFKDVAAYTWALDAILELADREIVVGKGDGIFDPAGQVTREEFVKMLVLGLDLTPSQTIPTFTDTAPDAWYSESIAAAQEHGLVLGADGAFGLGENITREDMATLCYRALQIKDAVPDGSGAAAFDDFDEISGYAQEAVSVMQGTGIISGVGDNRFSPKAQATRAEAAKIVYEIIRRTAQ